MKTNCCHPEYAAVFVLYSYNLSHCTIHLLFFRLIFCLSNYSAVLHFCSTASRCYSNNLLRYLYTLVCYIHHAFHTQDRLTLAITQAFPVVTVEQSFMTRVRPDVAPSALHLIGLQTYMLSVLIADTYRVQRKKRTTTSTGTNACITQSLYGLYGQTRTVNAYGDHKIYPRYEVSYGQRVRSPRSVVRSIRSVVTVTQKGINRAAE